MYPSSLRRAVYSYILCCSAGGGAGQSRYWLRHMAERPRGRRCTGGPSSGAHVNAREHFLADVRFVRGPVIGELNKKEPRAGAPRLLRYVNSFKRVNLKLAKNLPVVSEHEIQKSCHVSAFAK